QVAVPLVGTLFGNQLDLRTGRAALRSVGVSGGNAKLFDGVRTHAQHRTERVASLLFVYVHAIERDVGLVTAATRDVPGRRYGWLQTQQVGDVSRVERKLRDLLGHEVVSQAGVLRINQRFTGANRN